jgi:hypothetical protein
LDRYTGKPQFLKFVDLFVLDCIGELSQSQLATLEEMTPKLEKAFNATGTWQEMVMAKLNYMPEVRVAIRALWVKNQEIARQHGTLLTPMDFVHEFVKANIRVP